MSSTFSHYMDDRIFTYTSTTRFSDTDAAGIVYFSRFPMFFDEGFIRAMRTHNLFWSHHKEENYYIPIVEQSTKYHSPLPVGSRFVVLTGVISIGNSSFQTSHALILEEHPSKLIASGKISRVAVSATDFKPVTIPNNLLQLLKKYQLTEEEFQNYLTNL